MTETLPPRILIMDTGPLITLAAGEALDYLLMPGLPVIIPDAVFYEATRFSGTIGADDIADWAQANVHTVQIVPTTAYAAHVAMLESGIPPLRDLGERSAIEVGRDTTLMIEGEYCLLLSEDDRVLRGGFITGMEEGRIEIIGTHDFLVILEQAQRINSADAVYQIAEDAGRFASRRAANKRQHERAMAMLEPLLRTAGKKE
jgi:hypothetical protein